MARRAPGIVRLHPDPLLVPTQIAARMPAASKAGDAAFAHIKTEIPKWGKVIKAANIRAE